MANAIKAETERNYTEAQEARFATLAAQQESGKLTNALALALADEMGKDVRSIRAKASTMGLYQAQSKASKSGAAIESKEKITEQIGVLTGRNLESLAKAAKEDLRFIRDYIATLAA